MKKLEEDLKKKLEEDLIKIFPSKVLIDNKILENAVYFENEEDLNYSSEREIKLVDKEISIYLDNDEIKQIKITLFYNRTDKVFEPVLQVNEEAQKWIDKLNYQMKLFSFFESRYDHGDNNLMANTYIELNVKNFSEILDYSFSLYNISYLLIKIENYEYEKLYLNKDLLNKIYESEDLNPKGEYSIYIQNENLHSEFFDTLVAIFELFYNVRYDGGDIDMYINIIKMLEV